ncbi:DUF2341 domain-containing protein [bacterium]|nr:DUF2341 domain-containing protein [bacterium]
MYKKSFTLIELLVVIAIIGILAGVIIVSMTSATNSANDARRKVDLGQIVKSIAILNTLTGTLPSDVYPCTLGGGTTPCTNLQTELQSREIMKIFPSDPVTKEYYEIDVVGGSYYLTAILSDGTKYIFNSKENKYQSSSPIMADWGYRKAIEITNNSGQELSDFQIMFDVTYDTDMQTDFDDVRFLNDSVSLPYWIETKTDEVSGRFWVKIPSIPITGKTIYMYYGNAGATSESNLSNVFISQISGNVLALSMDEGMGTTTIDRSGSGRVITFNNSPTWKSSSFCNKGTCLQFNNSYLSLSSSPFIQSTAISYSFWFNATSTNGYFMGQSVSGGQGSGGVYINSYPYFAWTPTTPNLDRTWSANTANISTDNWHHIIYSVSFTGSSSCKIYVDGVEKTTTLSDSVSNGAPSTKFNVSGSNIGSRVINGTNYYFNGMLDEINIFNRALTSAEALDLYNNHAYNSLNYTGITLTRKKVSVEPTYSFFSEENN